MAQYLILIHGDERQWDAMTPAQWAAHDEAHRAFVAKAGDRIVATGQLEPASGATTLRRDAGGRVVTLDGPFQETKEVVGGYYLLRADAPDEVAELARLLPEVHAGHSGVEIRRLVDHDRP
jgi:hypothetical protein